MREDLIASFSTGKRPTGTDFAQLINSTFNLDNDIGNVEIVYEAETVKQVKETSSEGVLNRVTDMYYNPDGTLAAITVDSVVEAYIMNFNYTADGSLASVEKITDF